MKKLIWSFFMNRGRIQKQEEVGKTCKFCPKFTSPDLKGKRVKKKFSWVFYFVFVTVTVSAGVRRDGDGPHRSYRLVLWSHRKYLRSGKKNKRDSVFRMFWEMAPSYPHASPRSNCSKFEEYPTLYLLPPASAAWHISWEFRKNGTTSINY